MQERDRDHVPTLRGRLDRTGPAEGEVAVEVDSPRALPNVAVTAPARPCAIGARPIVRISRRRTCTSTSPVAGSLRTATTIGRSAGAGTVAGAAGTASAARVSVVPVGSGGPTGAGVGVGSPTSRITSTTRRVLGQRRSGVCRGARKVGGSVDRGVHLHHHEVAVTLDDDGVHAREPAQGHLGRVDAMGIRLVGSHDARDGARPRTAAPAGRRRRRSGGSGGSARQPGAPASVPGSNGPGPARNA